MDCPKCDSKMEIVSINEIKVDRCISCKGIWFDAHELSDAKKIKDSGSVDIGDSKFGKEQNQNDLINCPK